MSKADSKDSQLPVTGIPATVTPDLRPYVLEPIPAVQLPDLLPVLDIAGSFLMWVDEHTARQLLKQRKVEILRRKKGAGKIIGLMVIPDPDMPADQICSRKTYFGLPHKRDTEDNPGNVWTQDKMGSTSRGVPNKYARWARQVCKQVVLDAIAEWKEPAPPLPVPPRSSRN